MLNMQYKGKDLSDCSHEELTECIESMVIELYDARVRLEMVEKAITSGSGHYKVQPKTLPPLAVEGKGGLKP